MRLPLVVLFALATAPLRAEQFNVTFEGKPVADAQVCIFRGHGFAAGPVTCGGLDIAVPEGDWGAFARRGEELIGDRIAKKPGELQVVKAARADLWPVGEGERRFVYIPRTRSLLPVETTVPADTTLVPLTVANGRVVAVRGARNFAVAMVTIERAPSGRVAPPLVTFTDESGKIHKPVAPMASSEPGTEAIFFENVPATGTVTVAGDRWKTVTSATLDKPLVTTATSKLTVNWWLASDVSSFSTETPACDAKPSSGPPPQVGAKFALVLEECVNRNCSDAVSRDLPLDAARGSATFEGLPAGQYRMRIEYPSLPPLFKSIEVTPNAPANADFELRWFTFFGKVTRGGKPAHVALYGTVTDPESGEYRAVVSRKPDAGFLQFIRPCDGSPAFNYVPDEAPAENARYDIDIPSNRVPVEVRDAATGVPVAKAMVTLSALMPDSDDAAHFAGFGRPAGDDGRVDIGPVLTNRRLIVCAQHDDYLGKCTDPFVMKGIEEKTIRLDLTRAEKRAGRVLVPGNVEAGMIMTFGADGSMRERVAVKPDGAFTLKQPYGAGEIVAFVSRSHPLYVFALARRLADPVFEIRVPMAPLRSFNVSRAATATEVGFFTIALGDLVVPSQAISDSIARRGGQPALAPGWTAPVRDLVQTGDISVIFIPGEYLRGRAGKGRDPVLGYPEGRSLPREPLGNRGAITIP